MKMQRVSFLFTLLLNIGKTFVLFYLWRTILFWGSLNAIDLNRDNFATDQDFTGIVKTCYEMQSETHSLDCSVGLTENFQGYEQMLKSILLLISLQECPKKTTELLKVSSPKSWVIHWNQSAVDNFLYWQHRYIVLTYLIHKFATFLLLKCM